MPENIDDELIHLTCAHCGKISSISYGHLRRSGNAPCPYCGWLLPVERGEAHDDALRKAQELDGAPDGLGSHE
ncbi:MAG: hypothetical protein M3Y57_16675 [Acidobacteriota bacterium]|nr:hypothetical protein [Acidobacteriota bacterium]